jgi:dipicolinic acid synthetase A subunit
MRISLIGGDARMRTVARLLELHGATVRCLGMPEGVPHPTADLFSAMQGAEAIILPLPATRDGVFPTAAAGVAVPRLSDIFSRAEDECLCLGGMLPPTLLAMAAEAGIETADYYQSETLLEKNAALTAEAAIAMVITDLPVSLTGATVCVIGAGRIARHLTRLLRAFSADVRVYARRAEARKEAEGWGATVYPITAGEVLCLEKSTRAVFCTVPHLLFDRAATKQLPTGIPFYDLGGGGIDREAAEACGILLPPSAALPGTCSPESAGEYLFDEIRAIILKKRGVLL